MANSLASTFSICDVAVRQLDGLFSLNDLHTAAGGEAKHQPALFIRNDQAQALIAEIGNSTDSQSLKTVTGRKGGTYACREVVIAYAAWISAVFHLKVIRVFLSAIAPAPTLTIAPAQAQHLRELVQLVVESGQQNHGETWTRLHRKMKVNSYLALRPDQFDAACEYLRGKFDDTSIAAIAQKHFPQIAQLPAPAATTNMQLDVKTLCAMIHGGLIDPRAFIDIAYAVNQRQFKIACANQRRGYGQEVAEKIKSSMSDSDLHIINVAASMETWMRTTQPGVAA